MISTEVTSTGSLEVSGEIISEEELRYVAGLLEGYAGPGIKYEVIDRNCGLSPRRPVIYVHHFLEGPNPDGGRDILIGSFVTTVGIGDFISVTIYESGGKKGSRTPEVPEETRT